MIQITDFETDYLTYEMRRGRVVNPKWFRCPVVDSPEMQAVLCCDADNMVFGLAVLGAWEQLQRWCMRHFKRQGRFIMKSGTPMNLQQIAYAIGLSGSEDFLSRAIEILMGVGWLSALDDAPYSVLPLSGSEADGEVTPPAPKSLPPREETLCDEGKFSSSERFPHYNKVKALVTKLSKNPECPLATENPRKIETALCDAVVEGRDVETVVTAMSIYYSLGIGKDQYRTRPENFIRNRKDEENWDSWFSELEAKVFKTKILKEVNESEGGDKTRLHRMMNKHEDTKPTEMLDIYEEWKTREEEEVGYEI